MSVKVEKQLTAAVEELNARVEELNARIEELTRERDEAAAVASIAMDSQTSWRIEMDRRLEETESRALAAEQQSNEWATLAGAYDRACRQAEQQIAAAVEKLVALAQAEKDYRSKHDVFGDRAIEVGRAWDDMRHAGDAARAFLASIEDPTHDR